MKATKIALVISLALNIGAASYYLYNRPRLRISRKLPDQKPNFAPVEEALKRELAKPENAELYELSNFQSGEWLCRASVKDRFERPTPANWRKLRDIVDAVRVSCKIPGRTAGWMMDPDDPRRMIGHTLEFGYSSEVGYPLENEFIKKYKAADK